MFKSYLKIAWRSLLKHRLYSLINITGMAVGLTCFMLMALYIQYESSYDQQHEKANQIYRVAQAQEGNTFRGTDQFAVSPIPLVPSMREQFSEVETGTTITFARILVEQKGELTYEYGIYADEQLFDVFTYPIVEGDVKTALSNPDAIILTSSLAEKYFGETSPIGQMIALSRQEPLMVQAVIEDLPKNQHLQFNFVRPLQTYGEYAKDHGGWRWSANDYWSYVVLREGSNPEELEKKMIPLGEKAGAELARSNLSFNPRFFLQPLTNIHLHSNINAEIGRNGDIQYLYFAASIALIILLLALINYMNLATARTTQRNKEVGVRKVLGAQRRQLINQFMTESTLLIGISFIIAVALSDLSLPLFNQLFDLKIPLNLSHNPIIIIGLITVAILLGICSGVYPALVSSAITPVSALKGVGLGKKQEGAPIMRNAMVIGQFAVAIILVICSVVIYQQLRYTQTKKLGYNRDQVIYVPYRGQDMLKKKEVLRAQLLKHPDIEKVSLTRTMPLNTRNQGLAHQWEGKGDAKDLHIYRFYTDEHFINLFEMELVEGRNFSPDFPSDTSDAYILNEAAVKAIGWDSATGKSFREGKVIGVVKNFHFQPFDLSIEPMFISYDEESFSTFGNLAMKVKTADTDKTLAYIEQQFKEILPGSPFKALFMDESYQRLYKAERRFGNVFTLFTLIALFVACIGLFGLVTHSVLKRTKEIGIRKVLGASVANIVALISTDFLRLIILSAFIAIPLAWWGMNKWLQEFAYRIELDGWVFVLASLTAIIIALFTISLQSIKAARANPGDSIRTE